MNYKPKLMYSIVGLLILAGAFFLGASYGRPNFNQLVAGQAGVDSQAKTVDFLIDSGETVKGYVKVPLAGEQSVLEVLRQITLANNLKFVYDDSSPMGAFIKQIGTEANGQDSKYWQYWVNGSQPMVAANKFILKGGETVFWTFRKSAL